MIDNSLVFYTQQQAELENNASILKKKLINLGVFRLFVFLGTVFLIYLTFGDFPDVFIIAALGFSLFSFLVLKYINLKREKDIVDAKLDINKTEIKVLKREFHHLKSGKEFVNPAHYYSNDIDLFGKGSFFQYANRTKTNDGKVKLAQTFTENKIDGILEKQNSINELSEKVKWRQHFSALASLVTVKSDTTSIVSWMLNYKNKLPKFLGVLSLVFSVISVILIVLVSFSYIPATVVVIWFFVGLIISGMFVKITQSLYTETDVVRETFKQYHQLLNEIETEKFTSKNLIEKQEIIKSENKKASVIFKEFSKILDGFDQRNNIVIAVFGNGLFLWEIKSASKVEKWISDYKHTVKEWFEVVAYFDAQNSLGNFKFNHPKFVFPKLSDKKETIKSNQLGHPLLKVDRRIDNDFVIAEAQKRGLNIHIIGERLNIKNKRTEILITNYQLERTLF